MLLLSAIQAYVQKVNLFDLQSESKWKVITYGIIGSSGLPVFYYGFRYIPTSIGILIFYIHPLIVAIIASFVLNEILTKEKLLVALGSFAGAAVLLLHKNVTPGDVDHYYLGAMLAFYFWWTAWVMAIIARMVRGQMHYSIWPIYYNIFLGGGMFLCFIIYPTMFNVDFLTTFDVVMFLISGVFSVVGNNLRFLAFKHEEASKVSPFGYFEIFFTLLFDIFMFKYSFALTDVIGGIFILTKFVLLFLSYYLLLCLLKFVFEHIIIYIFNLTYYSYKTRLVCQFLNCTNFYKE